MPGTYSAIGSEWLLNTQNRNSAQGPLVEKKRVLERMTKPGSEGHKTIPKEKGERKKSKVALNITKAKQHSVPESLTQKGVTSVNKRRGKRYLCKNVPEAKKTGK